MIYLNGKWVNEWYFTHPIHYVNDIPLMIRCLTEALIWYGGNLNTAKWECTDKWIEYGYYQLIVTFVKN